MNLNALLIFITCFNILETETFPYTNEGHEIAESSEKFCKRLQSELKTCSLIICTWSLSL